MPHIMENVENVHVRRNVEDARKTLKLLCAMLHVAVKKKKKRKIQIHIADKR